MGYAGKLIPAKLDTLTPTLNQSGDNNARAWQDSSFPTTYQEKLIQS